MTPSGARPVRVALLGCGVVGAAVARLLDRRRADVEARLGAPVEIVGVAVRRPARVRDVGLPSHLFTSDAHGLVTAGDVDVVIEVIGGVEPARSLIIAALESGASVVTANKALLAVDSGTLFEVAEKAGRDLYFEAAVAGAIPIVRPLRESLAGDRVQRVLGIVNGTTNFVLDRMDAHGSGFEEALTAAQALGYAEPDPTADVEGFDAAAKAAILASLAFHTRVSADDVYRQGITDITAQDVAYARRLDCVIKLLAICERRAAPAGAAVSVRVHPAMVPRSHPLAGVRGPNNAVFVECEAAGELMFYGPGAGGQPTASAILGDLVTVARHRLAGAAGAAVSTYAQLEVLPIGAALTRSHVALEVDDRSGVLAAVATVFARHGVSIETVRQQGRGAEAELVLVTHPAADAALTATLREVAALPSVRAVRSTIRVQGLEG